jgi:hypothetical protein
MFLGNKHEDKRFTEAGIPKIQLALNFFMQAIFLFVTVVPIFPQLQRIY